jgi:hypothetical protein
MRKRGVIDTLVRMLSIGVLATTTLITFDQAQGKDFTGKVGVVDRPHGKDFTGTVNATSGKQARLSAFWAYGEDCRTRPFDLQTTAKPQNGILISKAITRKIVASAEQGFETKCVGKTTKAIEVFYKSKSGFKGKDRVKLRVIDRGKTFNYVFNLVVR